MAYGRRCRGREQEAVWSWTVNNLPDDLKNFHAPLPLHIEVTTLVAELLGAVVLVFSVWLLVAAAFS